MVYKTISDFVLYYADLTPTHVPPKANHHNCYLILHCSTLRSRDLQGCQTSEICVFIVEPYFLLLALYLPLPSPSLIIFCNNLN